jgi:release factor glutamine methyltransferase
MTVQASTFYLLKQLKTIYTDGEANSITDWVMQEVTGAAKAERMVYKNELLSPTELAHFNSCVKRLLLHEPVQYVLNQAWFGGMRMYVDKNVLIPRPETEELVQLVISSIEKNNNCAILDIGTGSGCIPIAIKKKLPNADVWACDISEDALAVARKNGTDVGTAISYIQADILNEKDWRQFPQFDIIISNPPYIPASEEITMDKNVTAYEPHLALFVPENDALVFYKAIVQFAKHYLKKNGQLFFEIHENGGAATLELLVQEGFVGEIIKDMQKKDRIVKSSLNSFT